MYVYFVVVIAGTSSLLAAVLAHQQQPDFSIPQSVEGTSEQEESVHKVKSENTSSMLLLQPQVCI